MTEELTTPDALSSDPEPAVAPAAPGLEETVEISPLPLPSQVEALLFVAPSPTPIARLAQVLEVDEPAVEEALAALSADYTSQRRGLRLIRKGDGVHLTSAAEAALVVEKFLGLDLSSKLSGAALETLAVIAYRQPLTRGEIEAIRGVNCDGVLKTLLARALVEPVGRLEQPGRPFLYGTTLQFLQYFGLEGLHRLPPLPGAEG